MLNSFIAQGRLVADPEIRMTPGGKKVGHFTVAVERNYKSGEERKTDFFNCVVFEAKADFVEKYFSKGQAIIVRGSLQNRSWEDKGVKRYATDVLVDEIQFCGKKENSTSSVTNVTASPQGEAFEGFMPEDSDDLPF